MRNVGAPTASRGKHDSLFPRKTSARAELNYLPYAGTYRNDGVEESVEKTGAPVRGCRRADIIHPPH
jgi:hypothetical protein